VTPGTIVVKQEPFVLFDGIHGVRTF
jgi:hypothetical protein